MHGFAKNLGLRDGSEARVAMRERTVRRLANTCFRGPSVRCAGNFFRWRNAWEFLADGVVVTELRDIMEEAHAENIRGTNGFTFDLYEPVGWASTAPVSFYESDKLERFAPSRRSTALRVRPECSEFLAPQTDEVTVIMEIKEEGDVLVGVVHSIYPGNDIGELDGDVSDREKVAFFHWSHPGE